MVFIILLYRQLTYHSLKLLQCLSSINILMLLSFFFENLSFLLDQVLDDGWFKQPHLAEGLYWTGHSDPHRGDVLDGSGAPLPCIIITPLQ